MIIPSTTPGALARGQTPIAAIVRRLAVVGVALTALGLSASAASANDKEEDERIAVKGGKAWFKNDLAEQSWPESLSVEDTRRDGYGVRAYLDYWSASGAHLTSYVTAPDSTDHNYNSIDLQIPEDRAVTVSVCYLDNGQVKRCSLGQRAYA
jgi:hypothetical protein